MTSTPFMQYQQDSDERTFRWHGGEYIEVGTRYAEVGDDEFAAFDVINVWDHAAGAPRIPRTLDAFAARCDEWIRDRADEES